MKVVHLRLLDYPGRSLVDVSVMFLVDTPAGYCFGIDALAVDVVIQNLV